VLASGATKLWVAGLVVVYVYAGGAPLWHARKEFEKKRTERNLRRVAFLGAFGLFLGYDVVLWLLVADAGTERDIRPCIHIASCDVIAAGIAAFAAWCTTRSTIALDGVLVRNWWSRGAVGAFCMYCVLIGVYWALLVRADAVCPIWEWARDAWSAEDSPLGALYECFRDDCRPRVRLYWAFWTWLLYGLCLIVGLVLYAGSARAETYAAWLLVAYSGYVGLGPNGGFPWYFRVLLILPAWLAFLVLRRLWSGTMRGVSRPR
jgi:hypothetical protein